MNAHTRPALALFLMQLVAHLSVIPFLFYASWHHWIIALMVYFITGCFGMTMVYHRLLSHQSWVAPRWFYYFGTLAGVYGLTGSPIAWVAIHREHHHHTDTERDPHSPGVHGFIRTQWLSMFEVPKVRYVAHLLRDPFQVWVHRHYLWIHGGIFVTWLLIDPILLMSAYLVPAAILWNAGSFINTLTHMVGYRNYDIKDRSTNIRLLGYLMWGEGWHNNHHAYPTNPIFGHKSWEIDIGGLFIRLLDRTSSISQK